eukprot:PhF_6_TR36633/c0_g2_i1/m.54045
MSTLTLLFTALVLVPNFLTKLRRGVSSSSRKRNLWSWPKEAVARIRNLLRRRARLKLKHQTPKHPNPKRNPRKKPRRRRNLQQKRLPRKGQSRLRITVRTRRKTTHHQQNLPRRSPRKKAKLKRVKMRMQATPPTPRRGFLNSCPTLKALPRKNTSELVLANLRKKRETSMLK